MPPLVLLTGFPGSGKSAFLHALLPALQNAGWAPAVIVNDLENATAAAAALASPSLRALPIGGACISRDAKEHFLDTLAGLPTSENSILLVSASPLADPIDLLESLTVDPRAANFTRPIQINTIDAMRWQRRGEANYLEGIQVITAPYLLVNRLHDLKPARRSKVDLSIRGLNPFAQRISASSFPSSIADLLRTENPAALPDHHFSTLKLPLAPAVSRMNLTAFLHSLPREVIRTKGITSLSDAPDQSLLFQKIDGIKEVEFLNLDPGNHPDPVLICIGPALPSEAIRRSAHAHGLTPAPNPQLTPSSSSSARTSPPTS